MEQVKEFAIVLKSIVYKENDKLLTLFSLQSGKVFAGIKGVLKPKAKLAFAGLPFCFGNYMLAKKGGYATVVGCDAQDSFFDITKDIERFYFGATMLEVCDILVKEDEPNEQLFLALLKALKLLAYSHVDPLAVVLKFTLDSLKFSGYKTEFLKCAKCECEDVVDAFFSFAFGGVVCKNCAKKFGLGNLKELSAGEYAILKLLSRSEFDALENFKFSSKENLFSCFKLVVNFFMLQTDSKLKSVGELLKMIK